MSTQVYDVKFADGSGCTVVCMEPATDEENIKSIRENNFKDGQVIDVKRKEGNEQHSN